MQTKTSNFLNEIYNLADQGFCVIPTKFKSKQPVVPWGKYDQQTKPQQHELRSWFSDGPEKNVSIKVGPSSTVVVLDVDDLQAFEDAKIKLPLTPTVKTSRGKHFYFKSPTGCKLRSVTELPYGELLGDNHLVSVPPSVHESGTAYEWIVRLDEVKIAELPSWLVDLGTRKYEDDGSLTVHPANDNAETTPYGRSALQQEIAKLSNTTDHRNNQANKSTFAIGRLVAGGEINAEEAIEGLRNATKENGLYFDETSGGSNGVEKTLRSAMIAAAKNPRQRKEPEPEAPKGKLKYRVLEDITPEKVDWLWEGILAKGSLSIIAGEPGVGKSTMALGIASIVSNGGKWPVTGDTAEQGNVVVLSSEDVSEYTVAPRLVACNAKKERCYVVEDQDFVLGRDTDTRLRKAIEEIGDVKLIIVDPITAHLGKSDNNNVTDIRHITSKLAALAQEFRLSVVIVMHLNKSDKNSPLDRLQGSGAWAAAARSAFLVSSDVNDKERLTITTLKNNVAPSSRSYSCRIVGVTLPNDIKTSRVEWENFTSNVSAEQVLYQRKEGGKLQLAIENTRELFESNSGTMAVRDFDKAMEQLSIRGGTLTRVRKALGLVSEQIDGVWHTMLPEKATAGGVTNPSSQPLVTLGDPG
ncbi:AAA family ATPase [Hyphomicrobium sp. ghe19]|uniref:AAA family ATPase n=1 Tax=Hyphomicrobium sp. ghe19 TaxID=2682968 RepID=UPI0013671176|nr:DNA repair protein RadA [Hyphomicrobium sp. ghe19]